MMGTIYLIAALYFMFRVLYKIGDRAGIFDEKEIDHEQQPTSSSKTEKFIRVESAADEDYDNIFSVGGFASYQGRVGQVVRLVGRTATIEIFSDCGNSNNSEIKNVPISKLQVVNQITWKHIK